MGCGQPEIHNEILPRLLDIPIKNWHEYNPQTSNIYHTLVGYKIVDHSDVVGASPVGAAPTTSLFST